MPKTIGDKFLNHVAGQVGLVREIRDAKARSQEAGESIILHKMIKTVKPNYRFYRAHATLIKQLQLVIDSRCKRLIVAMPPRHGKSELSSRILPAAFLLAHPQKTVAICSHSAELAEGFSRNAREYYKAAGGTLDPSNTSVNNWGTSAGGSCWAAGIGGSVVGRSADLIIADDTIKSREYADSSNAMEKLWSFYQGSLYTRLEPGDSIIVIVATRWCENDLTGRLLELESTLPSEKREDWTIIDLPAISEDPGDRPAFPDNCTVIPDWREEPGIPLCPQRYDMEALTRIKEVVGVREWSSQYQQRPAPIGGNMFNPEWWQSYEVDKLPPMDRIMLSVDCTFTKSATSDYVVGTVIGQSQNYYYIIDMDREKRDISETIKMMLRMSNRYRLDGTIIELAANGHAIYQTMHQRIPGLIGFKPAGNSKEGRAAGIVPIVEAGNVFLPQHAPWLDVFINEFSLFPAAKNDDIVDSVTQCINYMNTRTIPQVTTVQWGRSAYLPEKPGVPSQW